MGYVGVLAAARLWFVAGYRCCCSTAPMMQRQYTCQSGGADASGYRANYSFPFSFIFSAFPSEYQQAVYRHCLGMMWRNATYCGWQPVAIRQTMQEIWHSCSPEQAVFQSILLAVFAVYGSRKYVLFVATADSPLAQRKVARAT